MNAGAPGFRLSPHDTLLGGRLFGKMPKAPPTMRALPGNVRSIAPMFLKHLECSACGLEHESSRLQNLCHSCNKPLFAIVDLAAASQTLQRETLCRRDKSLWRYREVLPLPSHVDPVSLGEGGTPLLPAERFADDVDLWIKDESLNPTQSFKARGMSAAVSMAKYLGATKLAVPSAGNAGGALAAYAARAGLEAHVFMPCDTPRANIVECRELKAHVTLVDGLITDCAAEITRHKAKEGWFDVSTLKEPYRIEGKKTLGYETSRATELAIARCDSLSHRRWHRTHRDVESIPRNGNAWLDFEKTAAHVRRPGCRLRADCSRIRNRNKDCPGISKCAHHSLGLARSKSHRRFSDPRHSS
jgi:hypothetical protein